MSIFLAMIKAVEDRLNVKIDTQASKDVQVLKYPKYPKPPFRLKRAKAPSVAAVLAGYAPEGRRMARMTDETNGPDAARSKRHSGACLTARRCLLHGTRGCRGAALARRTAGSRHYRSAVAQRQRSGSGAGDHPDRRQRAVLLVVLAAAVLRYVPHLLRGCCLLCRTARASSAYSQIDPQCL